MVVDLARMRVLFVCTGNICRSALALAVLRAMAREKGVEGLELRSAGVAALEGSEVPRVVVKAGEILGVDLSGHRARLLSREDVAWADLVVTMEDSQARQVVALAPEAAPKTFTLKALSLVDPELLGEGDLGEALARLKVRRTGAGGIPDPYGADLGAVVSVGEEIRFHLSRLADLLLLGWMRLQEVGGLEGSSRSRSRRLQA